MKDRTIIMSSHKIDEIKDLKNKNKIVIDVFIQARLVLEDFQKIFKN